MKSFNKKYHKPGTKPGTLKTNENPVFRIDLYDYNATEFKVESDADVLTSRSIIESEKCTWIHLQVAPSESRMT